MRLGIYGYGKMGAAIERLSASYKWIAEIVVIDKGGDLNLIKDLDAVIDFSVAHATDELVEFMLNNEYSNPVLIGTTSLSEDTSSKIIALSASCPVLYAPNVSLGANLLSFLAKKAAEILGEKYDIDILDIHHRNKIDAPSGTALMIAENIASSVSPNSINPAKILFSNDPRTSSANKEIRINSIRAGEAIGEHNVYFHGALDSLVISHKMENRDLLADSALKALSWLRDQNPGLYSINDSLNLK